MPSAFALAPVLSSGFDLSDAPDEDALRLAIMAAVSTLAAVGVTFFTPETDERTRVAFYQRVRPFGFWRKTAAAAGDDPARSPRQLANRLALTATTAASLFLVLVGAGRLLVPAPDASTLVSLVYLGGGLALIPVWVRWGFGADALVEDAPDHVDIVEVSAQHEAYEAAQRAAASAE